jgi:hypothetical protein
MGQELLVSSIIAIAKEFAYDASISSIKINGKSVLIQNYVPYWDEKLCVTDSLDIDVV